MKYSTPSMPKPESHNLTAFEVFNRVDRLIEIQIDYMKQLSSIQLEYNVTRVCRLQVLNLNLLWQPDVSG